MTSPMIITVPGTTLTPTDEQRLRKIRPRGIALFSRNYQSLEQLQSLISSIKSVIGDDAIIAIDHEGGRIIRFPEILPDLPSPQELGRKGAPDWVCTCARKSGEALSNLGITTNFAPVVDLYVPGTHPSLADRCFGADPILVSEMSIAFIDGMRQAGIRCTAKHFPGIGSSKDDTHVKGTIVNLNRDELEVFWQPFRKTIAAGIDGVMISHATYIELDEQNPATLSRKIISGILRDELGFRGTVISDDLEMGAIMKHCSIEEATTTCLDAGCDLALICRDPDQQLKAFEAIKQNQLQP